MRGRRFRILAYADSPNLRRPAKSRRRDLPHSPSNRLDRADRRCAPIAGFSPSAPMTLGNLRETARFTRRPEQTSGRGLTAQGDLERMEHAKLAKGNGHESPIGRSTSLAEREQKDAARLGVKTAIRKKATPRKAKPAPLLRRSAASRNQTNWFAAIAGAVTWPRASSSGGIADAATVSVNAMGRRHRRGRRRSKSSSATTRDEPRREMGAGLERARPFFAEGFVTALQLRHHQGRDRARLRKLLFAWIRFCEATQRI